MIITKYELQLTDEQHPVMVKDRAVRYDCSAKYLDTPRKIVEMLNTCYSLNVMAEEYVYLICFNNKIRPIGIFELSHGTADSSALNMRELFIRVLLCGATSITIVHNHPSGDTTPSHQDMTTFEKIKDANHFLNIKLLDFIIIGADDFYSFCSNNCLN